MSTSCDHVLGEAEQAVKAIMALGPQQCEVYWTHGASLEVSLEKGKVVGGDQSIGTGGSVRLIHDGRLGFAHFTQIEKAPAAAKQAMELSRLAPPSPFRLPTGGNVRGSNKHWHSDLAGLDVDDALASAKQLVDGAVDVAPEANVAGGGINLSWGVEAIASSEGVAAAGRATHTSHGINLVLDGQHGAINVWDSQVAHDNHLRASELGQRCAQQALDLQSPQPAPSGELDVLLLPEAANELVLGIVSAAVDGHDARRGKSVWSSSLDKQVCVPELSVVDDSQVAGAVGGSAFDGDGMPTSRQAILSAGVLKTFLFGGREAADHGVASTGHAVRGGHRSPPGCGPHHLVVESTHAKPDSALIAGVDQGILVDSVLGAHTANTTTGNFSITAPNVWRIDKGELTPCKEVAIAGNLPQMLSRLTGVGSTPRVFDGAQVPMLQFSDVRVSA